MLLQQLSAQHAQRPKTGGELQLAPFSSFIQLRAIKKDVLHCKPREE